MPFPSVQYSALGVPIVHGYAYGEAVDSAVGPQFVRGASGQQNVQALLAGKVDYALLGHRRHAFGAEKTKPCATSSADSTMTLGKKCQRSCGASPSQTKSRAEKRR